MNLTLQYDQVPLLLIILILFGLLTVIGNIVKDIDEGEPSVWTVISGVFLLIGGIGFAYAVTQTPQSIDKTSLQTQAQETYGYDIIGMNDSDDLSDASGTFENPDGDRLDCDIRIMDSDSLPTKFTPVDDEDVQAEAMLICNGTEPKTIAD